MSVAPASLVAMLEGAADPQRAASLVYPLAAMLALTVAALTADQTLVLAIARWAARQNPVHLAALGFPAGQVPCQSTLNRLFRELDVWALAQQVQQAIAVVTAPSQPTLQGIAMDGKGHRSRLRRSGHAYAVHAVCAVCHTPGLVIAHELIQNDPAAHDTELPAARRLLARLKWTGRVMTGDRRYGQQRVCAASCAAGGDYLLLVGGNQGRRQQALIDRLTPATAVKVGTASMEEHRHGWHQERRELQVTTHVAGLGDAWPGVRQVFRLTRT